MKHALIPIGVFTVTLLGTTTWTVMKAPLPQVPVNEVARADSLLADSLWRDSVETLRSSSLEGDNAVALSAEYEGPSTLRDRQVAAVGEGVVTIPPAPTVGQVNEAYQSLARIFARMKPAEAAEVLRHMSNQEVEGVVRNLGARQAASVLANLPERRAAELARLLLAPVPEGTR